MFWSLIRFYSGFLLPEWMSNRQPDSQHFFRRKFTSQYRARLRRVYWLWLASSCLMLVLPVPAIVIPLALFTTFISFSLLDESGGS